MSKLLYSPVIKSDTLTTEQYEAMLPLVDVKKHLRMDHDDDDDIITIYRDAAIQHAMHETGRIFPSSSDYNVYMSRFPNLEESYTAKIPMAPVSSVVVKYHYGSDWQTMPTADYDVSTVNEPAHIHFLEIPDINEDMQMPIRLEITGGHGAIPKPIVSGILLFIGHLYENRQDVVIGTISQMVPQSSHFLFQSQRVFY